MDALYNPLALRATHAAPGMHTITTTTRVAGAGVRVHRRAALLNDAMTAAPVAGITAPARGRALQLTQ